MSEVNFGNEVAHSLEEFKHALQTHVKGQVREFSDLTNKEDSNNPNLFTYQNIANRVNSIFSEGQTRHGKMQETDETPPEVNDLGILFCRKKFHQTNIIGAPYLTHHEEVYTTHGIPIAERTEYKPDERPMGIKQRGIFRPSQGYTLYGYDHELEEPLKVSVIRFMGPGGGISVFTVQTGQQRDVYLGKPAWSLTDQLKYAELLGLNRESNSP